MIKNLSNFKAYRGSSLTTTNQWVFIFIMPNHNVLGNIISVYQNNVKKNFLTHVQYVLINMLTKKVLIILFIDTERKHVLTLFFGILAYNVQGKIIMSKRIIILMISIFSEVIIDQEYLLITAYMI